MADQPTNKLVEKDHWITVHPNDAHPGTHIQIDGQGRVSGGPASLRGRPLNNLSGKKPSSGTPKPGVPLNRLNQPATKPKPSLPNPPPPKPENKPAAETGPTPYQPEPERPKPQERPDVKPESTAGRSEPDRGPGGGRTPEQPTGAGGSLAESPSRPSAEENAGGRPDAGGPAAERAAQGLPAQVEEVHRRLDRFENLFRAKGNSQAADWMGQLRKHISDVGVADALAALGTGKTGQGEAVQYGGANLEGKGDADFIKNYLSRVGINLIGGTAPTGPQRAISSISSSSDAEGLHARGQEGDVFPALQTLRDKLHESQKLPGLEKSEDIGKLMGKEFGAKVAQFTPDVVEKLDKTYGEGKWIVKSYGDEAYAGYGIFFPQRAAQLQQEAQNIIYSAGQEIGKYGFKFGRDPDTGKIIGLQHESGDIYQYGTPEYNETIGGDVRRATDYVFQERISKDAKGNDINVGSPAASEQGCAIPQGSFMAQPAFPVVGITNEERAQGITFKKGQEGRVHIVTRNGKAEIVPNSTWLKEEHLPVVFENDETRAMAQAAVDAINALPESERKGQLYAPDIVKTADGYRVVEANPANEAGASGYLADNPLIIDAYVSHFVGREPAHVSFIRKLLSAKNEAKWLHRMVTKSLLKGTTHYDQQIRAAIDWVQRARGTPEEGAAILNYREIMDWAERDSEARKPGSMGRVGPVSRLSGSTPGILSSSPVTTLYTNRKTYTKSAQTWTKTVDNGYNRWEWDSNDGHHVDMRATMLYGKDGRLRDISKTKFIIVIDYDRQFVKDFSIRGYDTEDLTKKETLVAKAKQFLLTKYGIH